MRKLAIVLLIFCSHCRTSVEQSDNNIELVDSFFNSLDSTQCDLVFSRFLSVDTSSAYQSAIIACEEKLRHIVGQPLTILTYTEAKANYNEVKEYIGEDSIYVAVSPSGEFFYLKVRSRNVEIVIPITKGETIIGWL